ncbi:MAG: hypothetical protein CO090_05045 [Acidobacteria bacterium CG_4_9_14_3_um_filter_49_7]|nr:MAG: hypothetical protein CO090_05045 [Acidobacteria bacterium CG_4_9_14_3_um_filter_49_7]
MIDIIKLHLRNKAHSLALLVLVFLTITLLLVTLRLTLPRSGSVKSGMIFLGSWFGFLGPLLVLARGKNGEGKFLSRLPLSRFKIFLGKVTFLIFAYVLVTGLLCAGNWIISGLVKLFSNSVSLSGVPNGQAILNDAITFFKTIPFFLFLAALSLWLQKRISSNSANGLVVLGLVLIFGLIPFFTILTIQHHSFTISSTGVVNFLKSYGTLFVTTLNLALFFAAMGLYRLRHFRNF